MFQLGLYEDLKEMNLFPLFERLMCKVSYSTLFLQESKSYARRI